MLDKFSGKHDIRLLSADIFFNFLILAIQLGNTFSLLHPTSIYSKLISSSKFAGKEVTFTFLIYNVFNPAKEQRKDGIYPFDFPNISILLPICKY